MTNRVTIYFHTLRYLRPVQIYSRVWFNFYHPKPQLQPPPSLRNISAEWALPARKQSGFISLTKFHFLNEFHELNFPLDWNNPKIEKLWLYNLHYFDALNAQDSEKQGDWHRSLMARWVKDNPPGYGNGWEPYPSSLRIVNWIKWGLAGNYLEKTWVESLAIQVRYLGKRLEWHLLGNHLFANMKALVFAGVFFEGKEADGWLAKGLKVIDREIDEQILADGGHFERSPMYHSIIFEDLMDLLNLFATYPHSLPVCWRSFPGRVQVAAVKMRDWLSRMIHPDEEIALFNDAAFGIAPSPTELQAYAVRLGLEDGHLHQKAVAQHMAESGYVRCERGGAVLIVDVGEIGPDYLPGHAHADTLGFEMSLYGLRVFVDSGTSCYGSSEERLRQRSTRAHNTVEIDGQDSSEVWGGFRVARRARPKSIRITEEDDLIRICGAHDGYRRLPGRPLHCREWCLIADTLMITDMIEGGFNRAVARYHVHPDVTIEVNGDGREGHFSLPNGYQVVWRINGGKAGVTASTYHPQFGVSIQNQCLEVEIERARVEFTITWE